MQAHRLHHNAVVVRGKNRDGPAALASSADWVRLMDDRAFNCMYNASTVSCGFVHFFQELDVRAPSSPKVTPPLDHFVLAEI